MMKANVDKKQDNNKVVDDKLVADKLVTDKSEHQVLSLFADNRPEAVAKHNLQNTINNNLRVQQLTAIQKLANNSPRTRQLRAIQSISENGTKAQHAAQLRAMSGQHAMKTLQQIGIEEETLQAKSESVQKRVGLPTDPGENNTGLPDTLKAGIENLSGYAMDDVKVHYNSSKPAQLQAHAYAQGTNIHLGPGQEKHLPHEAWHVVQQKQGRVKPTLQMKSNININDDKGLEKEADVMGAKALQMQHKVPAIEKSNKELLKTSNDSSTNSEKKTTKQYIQPYRSSQTVIQSVWKTMGPGKFKWDRVMEGLQWFFHREEDSFSYRIVNDTDVSMEIWSIVESNEGRLLTETQLDSLGFEEIDFEIGDDRIEYEAPEPQFGPVDVSMVTKMGEEELVEILTKHLVEQTALVNYDRLSYINAFLIFMESNPMLSFDEALANFDIKAPRLLESMSGGHCGALSGSLLEQCESSGPGAYLVASKLPADYQQDAAPEYCHVAAMIRFQSPIDARDEGLILLEPGFNITQPIVIKRGETTSLDQGDEIWDFDLNAELTEVICQPRPKDSSVKWKAKKSRNKKMTYRTDVFLNPDMSLTVPLLRVDGRPQILGRDERGNVVAVIAINYAKERIEFRIGKNRFDPILFTTVMEMQGENFLGEAAGPLAELLHMEPSTLIERLYDAVAKWRPKEQ